MWRSGWGGGYSGEPLVPLLRAIGEAEVRALDRWSVFVDKDDDDNAGTEHDDAADPDDDNAGDELQDKKQPSRLCAICVMSV